LVLAENLKTHVVVGLLMPNPIEVARCWNVAPQLEDP
jgi:hypothetical protein